MNGFSYKNMMLQIIHGGIFSLVLLYSFYFTNISALIQFITTNGAALAVIFLVISFSLGVLIDFVTDVLESLILKSGIIKPPCFKLLKYDQVWGVSLAHRKFITHELIKKAIKHDETLSEQTFHDVISGKARNINAVNYLFQVAKNNAFRTGEDYQKEQIESFFELYIFSRNLSMSILLSLLCLVFQSGFTYLIGWLIVIEILTLMSAYRYNLYYSRVLLGTTFKEK